MVRALGSYVLFFFLVFTALGIIVSESTITFAQLFFLFSKNGMVYSLVIQILCFLISAISGFYLFLAYYKKQEDFLKSLMASCICVIFLFIWVFLMSSKPGEDYINALHFNYYEVMYLDFASLIHRNFLEILVSGFFYGFSLLFPCLFLLFGGCFDLQISLHRFAMRFFPSVHVCIMVLIASAFQPYYNKPNVYFYVDFLFFILVFFCIIMLFLRKRFLFGFYECANLILLIGLVFLVLACSNILVQSNYYNARYCLYLIAFLCWCSEWMFGDFEKS
ncbi:Uncharacterised protein [Helicobacter mustelae]|uniref:hypothetical protein n=1 Tax=Helicobacter mustelae TaxID=217 RepID=UPI000DFF108A|nr:hypothetical protein [Helicobacter mustelae]STP12494.1 Uncharacterised protein [Helicobacter mustelae]